MPVAFETRWAADLDAEHLNVELGYGTNPFAMTYLQPSSSTNLFYQPRQVQLGFRVTY